MHIFHWLLGLMFLFSAVNVQANIDVINQRMPIPPINIPPLNTPPIGGIPPSPQPAGASGVLSPSILTPTPTSTPSMQECTTSTVASGYGMCQGSFGSWDKVSHTRTYSGSECRTITTTSSCGGQTRDQSCRPCGYEQEDLVSPSCEGVIPWEERPLETRVLACEDNLSGCDASAYVNGQINTERSGVNPARACDEAGNCVDCRTTTVDENPPRCTAGYQWKTRWHREKDFDETGMNLRCWLERCEDVDEDGEGSDHVASGCLSIGLREETPREYEDIGGMHERVEVESEALEKIHRDTCEIRVCDNAGNCGTCESIELAYDGTNVCRTASDQCGNCAEGDVDCRCISGEREYCTDTGPVNCYLDAFNERCPGFDNEACLKSDYTPGCPVKNPCYPESNRETKTICPDDSIRFCARNPYHYGCNQGCKLGQFECSPEMPDGE